METIKFFAKSIVILAVLFSVFRYVADFNVRQSLGLTFVAIIGLGLHQSLAMVQRFDRGFSPFWVRVSPKWFELFRDYKIVQSDEKTFWDDAHTAWLHLQSQSDARSAATYSVLRDDIMLTVLKPDPFDGLIYWNSRRLFRSEFEFGERIEEIKIAHPNLEGFQWSPDVYLKWGKGGYELGLEVNADWWKKTCADDETKQLAKTKIDPQHLTGTTRLVIAMLPYSEFNSYTASNAPASWHSLNTPRQQQNPKDAELAKAGWKREEKDAELDLLGAPDRLDHKYFRVEHRHI